MVGTFETVTTRIGQDFEGVTRPIINSLNSVGDGFLSLDQSTRQVVAAFGFAAAALAGFAAARAGGNLLASVLKGGGAAAEGAAAGGGILSTLLKGGGWVSRLGMLGNMYTGWQIGSAAGQGVAKVGEVAGGKYWMPKDADEAGDMRSQRDELMAKINQIRSVSKIPEAAEIAIKPLQDQVDQLNLRIQAFDQLNVKPTIDTTSIDEAQGKATTLRATLSGLGIATGGNPAATRAPTADPPTPISGARAAGGPVQSGKTYLVGEEGPELFTPGRSGGITPNGGFGGASIVFNNTFNVGSQEGAREIAKELNRQMNRSAQTAFGVVRPYDGG